MAGHEALLRRDPVGGDCLEILVGCWRPAARIRAAGHLALRRGTRPALPPVSDQRRIIAGTSLSFTSLLNAGMSVSSTAFNRSSCTCSAAASSLNTCSDCAVGAASALATTPASAAILLFSRIG